jgi:hypothetical protein
MSWCDSIELQWSLLAHMGYDWQGMNLVVRTDVERGDEWWLKGQRERIYENASPAQGCMI